MPGGVLPHFFDLPTACYLLLFAAGVALLAWGEADKKRKQKQEQQKTGLRAP
ncbi:hypothetical protein ACH4TE_30880 [Streptomyces sioyaensis]|uniref:hypothetical protein n=1 Tax=Streptomyces sioyaensis TaxID=67364 RepID=UPI0037B60075